MKRLSKKIGVWIVVLLLLTAVGAGAFVYSGVYNVAATHQHTPPVYWLIQFAMQRSVATHAKEEKTPDLSRTDTIESGFRIYQSHCVQCHGAPGVSPDGTALGMMPVPAYLPPIAHEWTAAKIHWVVRNGIKMTGMPAWQYRLSENEIWQVVAFVKERLPYLSAEQYRDMAARTSSAKTDRAAAASVSSAAGDPPAGKRAMQQYACITCHLIPGVTGAARHVGPTLHGMANRAYIAGVLPNTTENMVRWLMSPPQVDPLTAMPDLGITEADARNMAAYLGTLTGQ